VADWRQPVERRSAMTVEPDASQSDLPPDLIDLDELFRDAKPVEDLDDLAIPDFFESDEELDEFQTWVRTQRLADLG
jgi:hypothetical protein